jgi:hypothetical protein
MHPQTAQQNRPIASLAGLLACAAIAVVSGRQLNSSTWWIIVFVPCLFGVLHCIRRLLNISKTSAAAHALHDDANGRHPNQGLANPATGLFIGSSGFDATGHAFGAGSREGS